MLAYTYSGKLAIINLIIWLFLLVYYFRNSKRNNIPVLAYVLILLFATFAFSETDTYHYHEAYDQMLLYNSPVHVENFYFWLINILPQNYYIWRFVIWGISLILLQITFKRYKLDVNSAGLCFTLILLQQFIVTRGSLGVALFMFAISLFLFPSKSRIISYILSAAFIALSIYLHRSLPVYIGLLVFAFIPLNKITVILSLILLPILRTGLLSYVYDILSIGFFSADTMSFVESYLEDDKSVANLNGFIRHVIELFPIILMFVLLIKEYVFKKKYIDKSVKFIFNYSYVLFYVAMLFWGQQTSSFISSRTIHMMCYPLVIVAAYYMSTNKRRNVLFNISLIGFIIADLFAFLYTIFKYW